MSRRPVRVNVQLPELTPAQAGALWHVLEDLASALWDAYESDILELEDYLSPAFEPHDDSTADEYEAHLGKSSTPPDLVGDSAPELKL